MTLPVPSPITSKSGHGHNLERYATLHHHHRPGCISYRAPLNFLASVSLPPLSHSTHDANSHTLPVQTQYLFEKLKPHIITHTAQGSRICACVDAKNLFLRDMGNWNCGFECKGLRLAAWARVRGAVMLTS